MLDFKVANNSENLIIFIHGFMGDKSTWDRTDEQISIMQSLIVDTDFITKMDIAIFDYHTKLMDFFSRKLGLIGKALGLPLKNKKNLDITQLSELLETQIKIKCKNYKRIILIGHSMGGLISKQLILKELSNSSMSKIKLFISLAVPHNGSDHATLARLFFKNTQIKDLTPLGNSINKMTNEWIAAKDKLPRTIYFQGKTDDIVPETSSIAFDARTENIEKLSFYEDHFSIVVPDVLDGSVVFAVKQECLFILEKEDLQMLHIKGDTNGATVNLSTEAHRMIEAYRKDQIKKNSDKLKKNIEKEFIGIDFFERIFESSGEEIVSYQNLQEQIQTTDFLLIYGMGGIGKSLILRKLLIDLIPSHKYPFFILCDAKNWDDKYSAGIEERNEFENKFSSLLDGFESGISFTNIQSLGISKIDPDVEKIIFIDGLNEIPSDEIRKRILNLLKLINSHYGFKIVITTRHYYKNEFKNYDAFKVKKIDDVKLKEIIAKYFKRDISQYSEKNLDYLSIPFFLQIAIESGKDIITNYSNYISSHVFKNIEKRSHDLYLKHLSSLAFDAYQSDQKFIIPKIKVTHQFEKQYVNNNKILIADGVNFKFEHHLINEYLVAFRMAKNSQLWNDLEFDKITFEDKKSFEIIQMILEQLSSPEEGDKFLTAVYDWNFYAVLHCISHVENSYTIEFARVIVLILTEKLFDKFAHTRTRITHDLIRLIEKFEIKGVPDLALIDKMDAVERVAKFREIITENANYFEKYYTEWFAAFSYSKNPSDAKFIKNIIDDNSLIGWSCANVLKRNKFTDKIEIQLIILFESSKDYIKKWRIAHALGNATSKETQDFLLEVVTENKFLWVTYGAVRSILEIAMFELAVEDSKMLLNDLLKILEIKDYDTAIIGELRACICDKVTEDKVEMINDMYDSIINSKHENFDEEELFISSKKKFIEKNAK